jgi:signal transduction histidine kinase
LPIIFLGADTVRAAPHARSGSVLMPHGTSQSPEFMTSNETSCPLAGQIAARIRENRRDLTERWLNRLADRLTLEPNRIFPTGELLDHVPLLLLGIADHLEDPTRTVSADGSIVSKARELGALRYAQGFDEYEIMKEYEIFGSILFSFVEEIIDDIGGTCSRSELIACTRRLFHAIVLIQQATATQHLQLVHDRLNEREQRLDAFNRSLAHEFRNRVGAAKGAAQLLLLPDLAEEKKAPLARVVARSTDEMQLVLENLLELSRGSAGKRPLRRVTLQHAAEEAVRQLRLTAEAAQVEVRLLALPECDVNAAGVELCLTNLVSNAIKYADPQKQKRWVEISGRRDDAALAESMTPADAGVIVEVRDNGRGVPQEKRNRLFERFYRAHEREAVSVEGTGLGLNIVKETAESMGGRVFAEFTDEGSIFGFSMSCGGNET